MNGKGAEFMVLKRVSHKSHYIRFVETSQPNCNVCCEGIFYVSLCPSAFMEKNPSLILNGYSVWSSRHGFGVVKLIADVRLVCLVFNHLNPIL